MGPLSVRSGTSGSWCRCVSTGGGRPGTARPFPCLPRTWHAPPRTPSRPGPPRSMSVPSPRAVTTASPPASSPRPSRPCAPASRLRSAGRPVPGPNPTRPGPAPGARPLVDAPARRRRGQLARTGHRGPRAAAAGPGGGRPGGHLVRRRGGPFHRLPARPAGAARPGRGDGPGPGHGEDLGPLFEPGDAHGRPVLPHGAEGGAWPLVRPAARARPPASAWRTRCACRTANGPRPTPSWRCGRARDRSSGESVGSTRLPSASLRGVGTVDDKPGGFSCPRCG